MASSSMNPLNIRTLVPQLGHLGRNVNLITTSNIVLEESNQLCPKMHPGIFCFAWLVEGAKVPRQEFEMKYFPGDPKQYHAKLKCWHREYCNKRNAHKNTYLSLILYVV